MIGRVPAPLQEITVDKHRSDATPDSGDIETAADRREQAADVRESALDTREFQVMAREDAESERADQMQKILTAANRRDEQAEARDSVSSKRDMAANLDDWMRSTGDDEAHKARDLAWDDRAHSRHDRIASADDRDHLAYNGTRPSADSEKD
jgi:hypothetical protein